MNQDFFTLSMSTGEFAELCQITKDTLFHYDEIGLLQPKINQNNHYNRYHIHQFYQYHSIKMLKSNGCSLQEIRDYLNETDYDFLALSVREQKNRLKKLKQYYEQSLQFIHTAEEINKALNQMHGKSSKPNLIRIDRDQSLLVTPIDSNDKTKKCSQQYLHSFNTHIRRCNDIGIDILPIGTVMTKENFMNQCYIRSGLFSKISPNLPGVIPTKREAGLYVTRILFQHHSDDYCAYTEMKQYIEDNGLFICGNTYETDLSAYCLGGNQKNTVLHIATEVSFHS